MDLYFLGTGAGMPSKQRNVTSIALRLYEERGTFWMFDCGEGTQHQVLRSPLKLSKLEKLFITHLHGDHIYGIPGLLSSRSHQGGVKPLTIYGPVGLQGFIESALSVSGSYINYAVHYVELEDGIVFEDEGIVVSALKLDHGLDSYGYRIEEKDRPGSLLVEKLRELGIESGPRYGQIKRGEDIQLTSGEWLHAADFISPSRCGHIVTILGDTRYCQSAITLADRADILVHEATFAAELSTLATQYYHSTTTDAARIAVQACVTKLVLTHISARYDEMGVELLIQQAKSLFPNVVMAHDHIIISIESTK